MTENQPPGQNKYWYVANYICEETNQYKEASGGLHASSPVTALDGVYSTVKKRCGIVQNIKLYILKPGGELGEVVATSGPLKPQECWSLDGKKKQTKDTILHLPAPDKEKKAEPDKKEATDEEYKEVDLHRIGTIMPYRHIKTLSFGDQQDGKK